MKVIAIDIDSSRVIIYAVELLDDGSISNVTGEFKSITIKDCRFKVLAIKIVQISICDVGNV